MTRPPGPEPATVVRSMPASLARRRFAGDVITRPARAMDTTAAGVPAAAGLAAVAGAAAGAAGTAVGGAAALATAAEGFAAGAAPAPPQAAPSIVARALV